MRLTRRGRRDGANIQDNVCATREVRCDSSPWCLKQVRSLIAQMIRQLNENEEGSNAR
jgi:hypothetical protein